MTAWLWRLMPARRTTPPPHVPAPPAAAVSDAPRELDAVGLSISRGRSDLAFLAWLLQRPAEDPAPLQAREEALLLFLDRLAADPDAHARLLPRAAAVVPALLARLRDPSTSLSDLAQRVSRDITLVAEVIRMANSPRYRRDSAVVELGHAIQVLGIDGLRQTIARVVLKPLIDVRGGELVARSATRLWDHTDKKAQLCAALAHDGGLDAFDAFVLALAHSAAWSVTLRVLDTFGAKIPWHVGGALAEALVRPRDRLLAAIAQQWQLPDSVTRAAAEVGRRGLTDGASDPVLNLFAGDRLASSLCISGDAGAALPTCALPAAAGKSVQACLLSFASPQVTRPG